MRFIELNQLAINIASSGSHARPALVFVNSLGTDFRIWDYVLPGFESHFHLIRYDKRGHGLSDAPAGAYCLQDHIDDLDALLAKLKISQAIICGVSVGGMIAQGFCAQHPDRVLGLVLCDTAAKIGTTELWNERIDKVTQGGIVSIADAILERWFSEHYRRQNRAELSGWRNMLTRTPVVGYAGTCAAIREADLTESTRTIACPALAVCGDQDGATPPDIVRTLTELIPGSRFKLIDGAGHLPSIEQPEALIDCMKSFFREMNIVEL